MGKKIYTLKFFYWYSIVKVVICLLALSKNSFYFLFLEFGPRTTTYALDNFIVKQNIPTFVIYVNKFKVS